MSKIVELREKRAKAIHDARELLDQAEADNRPDLNEDEQRQYDAFMADADTLKTAYEREERLYALEADLRSTANVPTPVVPGVGANEDPEGRSTPEGETASVYATPEYRSAYTSWLRGGNEGLTANEYRALQVDSDIAGGYLVTPEQFVNSLIQAVDNAVYVRQAATVYAVPNADSLGAPALDADPADPTWTSELLTGDADTTMTFGKRDLKPHPLAQRILVSDTLLRKTASAEGLVRDRLAYKLAVVQENAFLNGTGANQPLGVFTASAAGINTGQDASTGNTNTAITFDGLIEAKYTLKGQYWPRASWLFHRDAVKMIAKLKDGEGQYLWRESVRAGEPDRVLGLPSMTSEYAPSTFTSGLYVGILGDWSNYWIADSLAIQIKRLDELYAATNQVGFISRVETDGMPVLEEAFVRVTLT